MMMKNLIPTFLLVAVFAALAISPAVAQQKRQTLQQVFDQAVADFNAKDYDEAKTGFQRVLKAKPGLPHARKYLAQIESIKRNPVVRKVTMEPRLAELTVPKFSFEEASLGTVLDYLSQKSTEISDGKVTANFIYKGPAEDRDKKFITLSLSNVPLTEVIRYVGAQVGVRFTYDEFAVVGTPLDGAQQADTTVKQEQANLQQPTTQPSFLEEREAKERQAQQNPFE
jgi:hypothetical protein